MDASVQDPARAIARAVGALWWVWLAFGIFWIAVAFVVLQFDQASITTVGVLIGFMFLFAGFQQLFIAIFAEGWPRWVLMIFGVLLLIAAVLSFVEPKNTFAGVADILGFIFLLIGVFWTIRGARGAGDEPALVDQPDRRHRDGDHRLLDRGPVLHRQGLPAARVRRHLGPLPRRH